MGAGLFAESFRPGPPRLRRGSPPPRMQREAGLPRRLMDSPPRQALGGARTRGGRRRHGVVHELLRRRPAPRPADLSSAPQVARDTRVEDVGVGPVLVHPAPWVPPIVKHLAAQRMTADTPKCS